MAIQTDITTSQFGVPFAGAYFRIVTAALSRTRNADVRHSVMIDVAGYATKPLDEDTRDIEFRRYHADYNAIEACVGGNFLAKCYSWVSTQEDMTGSIGV